MAFAIQSFVLSDLKLLQSFSEPKSAPSIQFHKYLRDEGVKPSAICRGICSLLITFYLSFVRIFHVGVLACVLCMGECVYVCVYVRVCGWVVCVCVKYFDCSRNWALWPVVV